MKIEWWYGSGATDEEALRGLAQTKFTPERVGEYLRVHLSRYKLTVEDNPKGVAIVGRWDGHAWLNTRIWIAVIKVEE